MQTCCGQRPLGVLSRGLEGNIDLMKVRCDLFGTGSISCPVLALDISGSSDLYCLVGS